MADIYSLTNWRPTLDVEICPLTDCLSCCQFSSRLAGMALLLTAAEFYAEWIKTSDLYDCQLRQVAVTITQYLKMCCFFGAQLFVLL